MDKIKMKTSDITEENISKIAELFPNCITETKDKDGKTTRKVDFDLLRQELSKEIVEGGGERYRLDWPGKRESILRANTPIEDKTLRPVKEESEDFENTENLYIEGDNFEVLKLLQESYLKKVKMIYIDPPYNTGKDFIYKDNFKQSKEDYNEETDAVDADGYKLYKNTTTNGRYHSDWLSMMYERLVVAKDLLRDDGVIFISIDDNEVHNLRKICDEIFGEGNFVAQFIATSAPAGTQSSVDVAQQHSYCLAFVKSNKFSTNKIELSSEKLNKKYNKHDELGSYYIERLWKRGVGGKKEDVPSLHFPVYYDEKNNRIFIDDEAKSENDLIKIIPYQTKGVLGRWTWARDTMKRDRGKLVVKKVAGEYRLHKKNILMKTMESCPIVLLKQTLPEPN
jgi:adenine-specific DNA-methyltransferase